MIERSFPATLGFALVEDSLAAERPGLGTSAEAFDCDGLGLIIRCPWPTAATVVVGSGRMATPPDAVAHVELSLPPHASVLRLASLEELLAGTGTRVSIEPGSVGSVLVAVIHGEARYRLTLIPPGGSPSIPARVHHGALHMPPWTPQLPAPGVRARATRRPPTPPTPEPAAPRQLPTQGLEVETRSGIVVLFHPDALWEFPDHDGSWFRTPGVHLDAEAEGRLVSWRTEHPGTVRVLVHVGTRPAGSEVVRVGWYRSHGSVHLASAEAVPCANHAGHPGPAIELPAGDWLVALAQAPPYDDHHLVFRPAPRWQLPAPAPSDGSPFRFTPPGTADPGPLPPILRPRPLVIRFHGDHTLQFDDEGALLLDDQPLPAGGRRLKYLPGPPPQLRVVMPDGVVEISLPPRQSFLRALEACIRLFAL